MRFFIGTLCTAILLIGSAAVGVIGSWALSVGAVSMLAAATMGAIVLEQRDAPTAEDRLLERISAG